MLLPSITSIIIRVLPQNTAACPLNSDELLISPRSAWVMEKHWTGERRIQKYAHYSYSPVLGSYTAPSDQKASKATQTAVCKTEWKSLMVAFPARCHLHKMEICGCWRHCDSSHTKQHICSRICNVHYARSSNPTPLHFISIQMRSHSKCLVLCSQSLFLPSWD